MTPRGAIRATFKETVVEVHLLVAEGHAVVEDPMIQSVRKKTRAAGPPPGAVGPTP